MGNSILLVYKSKTGFTKKYVDWIDEVISCQKVPFDQINNVDINNYGIIIYGAGMHAGRIQGLKEFKNKVLNLAGKKIVVFATGGAPYTEEIISTIKTDNFSANELNKISFFYFQSGINYDKMRFLDKTIMKTYNRILEFKNDKSDIEDGTNKAISRTYDHSSRENIKPMIDYLNKISN
ncbi:flavodoxin domain-containing protein [Gudongella sp. DL1XJH-153]|uniref:flavodoxin domain-containing protein n=1 Tax=Gudongella sp. DL1XJH-153 TaxID=3409804 RepID=UPI003BB71AE4